MTHGVYSRDLRGLVTKNAFKIRFFAPETQEFLFQRVLYFEVFLIFNHESRRGSRNFSRGGGRFS